MSVYAAGKQDWFAAGLPREGRRSETATLADVMRQEVPTCQLGDRIRGTWQRVEHAGFDLCAVIAPDRTVLGLLRRNALEGDGDRIAEEVMQAGPSTFRPNVSVEEMGDYMREHEMTSALVTDSEGRLLGVAFRDDIDATLAHERGEHAAQRE